MARHVGRTRWLWLAPLAVVAGVIAIAALLYVLLPTIAASEKGRHLVVRAVERATGYEIGAESLHIGRIGRDLEVACTGLRIAERDAEPFFIADSVSATFPIDALVRGRAGRVAVEGFEIHPERMRRSSSGSGSANALRLRELAALDGELRFEQRPPVRIVTVRVEAEPEASRLAIEGRIELAFGAGQVHWEGGAGLDGRGLSVQGVASAPNVRAALGTLGIEVQEPGTALGFEAFLRVSGDLDGKLQSELEATLGPGGEDDPVVISGTVELDRPGRVAHVDLELAPAPDQPSLTVRGRVADHERRGSPDLDLDIAWEGVGLSELLARMVPRRLGEVVDGSLRLAASVTGSVAAPLATGIAKLSDITIETKAGELGGTFEAPFVYEAGRLGTGTGELRVEGLELVAGALEAGVGEATARVEAHRSDTATIVEIDRLALRGVDVNDSSFMHVLAGMAASGSGELRFESTEKLSFGIGASVEAGELLWDKIYTDLGKSKPELKLSAARTADGIRVESIELVSERMGRLSDSLGLDRLWRLERLVLEADLPGLGTAYDVLVREPLKDVYPTIWRTRLGGRLRGDVSYRRAGAGGWSMTGMVKLEAGSVEMQAPKSQFTALDVELPIELGQGSGKSAGRAGAIRMGPSNVRGIDLPAFELPLRVARNEVAARAPLELAVLGGGIEIAGLRGTDLAGPDRKLSFSLALSEIDMATLTAALDLPAAQGRIDGRLATVEASGTEIVTTGEVRAELFGGRVAVRGLRASRLFSRVPTFHMDVEARGLDLERASASLGVGSVKGIVDATIDELELVRGQPMRFDAALETVPARGTKQRISVTAIEQLSILGGAASSSITRGLLGFFDEYRYAKMGFRCSLRNDRFLLRGVEQYEGKDFLVVGTFVPPTVNVISHNQVIAFGEMVRRIARISALGRSSREVEGEVRE